jgi:hypothetical protein
MLRSFVVTSAAGLVVAACASTPGARPQDMSAVQHQQAAQAHTQAADAHAKQFDPKAVTEEQRCTPKGVCWTSIVNPTTEHERAAEEHRRHAADHRAASLELRNAEERACGGIAAADRDMSPFEHTDDIVKVERLDERIPGAKAGPATRLAGAVITFRAVPGLTAEWLQRTIDCHLARNASLGNVVPEMPTCPLVPKGAVARVTSTGDGFAVAIRAEDQATSKDILERAQRLHR